MNVTNTVPLPTFAKGSGPLTLPAGGSVTFYGVTKDSSKARRKLFRVYNNDQRGVNGTGNIHLGGASWDTAPSDAKRIWVRTANDVDLFPVDPLCSEEIETDDDLKVASGDILATQQFYVCEIFWDESDGAGRVRKYSK